MVHVWLGLQKELGWRKLSTLNLVVVPNVFNNLKTDSSRRDCKAILVDMINRVMESDMLHKNVALSVNKKIENEEKEEKRILTDEEVELLLKTSIGGCIMKTMKKFFTTMVFAGLLISNTVSFAHSGRTDSNGGHHDYQNKSGLGSYHYHHGMGPHLHPNGVCPYSSAAKSSSSTKKTSKYYKSSTVKKVQIKLNKLGYSCGKADGAYGAKTKNAIKKFQKKKGLAVNGSINKTLLKKLNIRI